MNERPSSHTSSPTIKPLKRSSESYKSDPRYQQLLRGIESIKDYAIFLLDTKGYVISWNEGAKRIKGYEEDEIIGQHFSKFYLPEANSSSYPDKVLIQAKENGQFKDEGNRVRKDGSTFWANVLITPLYDDAHEHIGFIKVTRDLTERKEAELALACSEQRYRTITSLAPNGIFHFDAQGNLIFANKRSCEILELSTEQMLGNGWFKAIHPEDKASVHSAFRQALITKNLFKMEFRFKSVTGKVIWVIALGSPELDKHQNIRSYTYTFTDITERKMLEQKESELLTATKKAEFEQRKRAEEAEENQRRVKTLMDMVCHGMRNPMTGMSGNNSFIMSDIESMKKSLEEYSQRLPQDFKQAMKSRLTDMVEYVTAINECIRQQKEIADRMLDLTRLESQSIKADISCFRPKEVLRSIAASCKSQLEFKGLKLILRLPDEDVLLKSDSNFFGQIINNLLNNAIKFTSSGQISISLNLQGKPSSYLLIVIEDTGIGMTPEELSRIFSPFTQANKKILSDYGGSGLGLSISKKLVELLGGKINIESMPGKGTKLTFTIRCEELTEEEKKIFDARKEQTVVEITSDRRDKNKHILLVEDNILNQKVMGRILEENGVTYEIANNGKEALEIWKSGKFDIVFMDIKMPEMDGFEATLKIRQQETVLRCVPTPIIGLSADALDEQKQEAFKMGMNDYLIKPYTREQIYLKIQQWTEFRAQPVLASSSSISLSQLTTVPMLFPAAPPLSATDTPQLSPTLKKKVLHLKDLKHPVIINTTL